MSLAREFLFERHLSIFSQFSFNSYTASQFLHSTFRLYFDYIWKVEKNHQLVEDLLRKYGSVSNFTAYIQFMAFNRRIQGPFESPVLFYLDHPSKLKHLYGLWLSGSYDGSV
ncbi:hypothetical protein HanXRQr2_Chr14g0634101 [Helianthus annuus]|uniref:Uncharacterized protein n=1 Tax=Helianthus annuus TaxID=4232 RepID=A0A9K3E776_HELAN|nr:hypothetical protein HanXRQr2_Chr14g0634101 [Helianthus annuus]KAJ0659257.1 hypothetical protein HanOQP8_Chr14g0524031 [Helianthus annuus]KAJ0839545.1 hypothetical protein HanPSC8_Chr14g0608121 [Helianthus annuus]